MQALIIDDEPPAIRLIKMLVDWKKYGIEKVYTAINSEEAESIIEKCQPEIILSDINLPRLSGLQLIEKIRARETNVQVIFVSAYDDFSYAQKAIRLNCVDYILKPVERGKINKAIEKAVLAYHTQKDMQLKNRWIQDINIEEHRISQNIFLEYILNIKDRDLFEELVEFVPFIRKIKVCKVGVISLGYLNDRKFSPTNIEYCINRILFEQMAGIATVLRNNTDILFIINSSNIEIENIQNSILKNIHSIMQIPVRIGLSEKVIFPAEIEKGYQKALACARSESSPNLCVN